MKLYAQIGHQLGDQVNQGLSEGIIDGAIFSPKDLQPKTIGSRIADVRRNFPDADIFFDPQFYLPSDAKSKLKTYDFFPANLKDDFNTSDFQNEKNKLTKLCPMFHYHQVSSPRIEQSHEFGHTTSNTNITFVIGIMNAKNVIV